MAPFPDTAPVTTTGLLAEVRATRATAVTAEAHLLQLAADWADAHPPVSDPEPFPGQPREDPFGRPEEVDENRGIPAWSWSASAPFAAAIGRSTAAGEAMIRDALILRHRLPRVWSRVLVGEVEAYRARRIAQVVIGAPDDVCAHLDDTLAGIAHKVGPVTLERLMDEAMLRLHAEERELAQLEQLESSYVALHESSISHTGLAELHARGDWKDLHDFEATVSRIAAALAEADHPEPIGVRRSRALGVLADPAAAQALLEGLPGPAPTRRTVLYLHYSSGELSDRAMLGANPVGRNETLNVPVLEQQVRAWCGRTDTHLTVTPVLDLRDHAVSTSYEVPDRLGVRVGLIAGHCVFPWCTRPARACDLDHRVPHGTGGISCECNLAPLCRRHHRLKTHAGWRYTALETGVWLWSDPHGQQFLRDGHGTLDVTPPDRPVAAGTGCRAGPLDTEDTGRTGSLRSRPQRAGPARAAPRAG